MHELKDKRYLTTGGDDHFLPKLIDAINNAIHIDIAVAFIRSTGLTLLQSALVDALQREENVTLRIITGDYLAITEPAALRRLMLLQELGAEIKIFETKGKQSFHMKAYIFTKGLETNNGLAFVGSSNISRAALIDGLEWNLQVDESENLKRFTEIKREYSNLFSDHRAIVLSHDWINDYQKVYDENRQQQPISHLNDSVTDTLPTPIPNGIQLEALVALSESRHAGFRRGLVVLATGMGKTWLSAFDAKAMNAKKILFVAHREEILLQAEDTFLCIQPNAKVGRYNGKEQSLAADYLFASIQTLGKKEHLKKFDSDYFDYIVVDEFHHAAARTYQQLLAYFQPAFMLGLTATPERTDQSDILSLCDDNLVYCKELFDGIKSNILSPFNYYGIGDDGVDYTAIPWRNGKFDEAALYNQLATRSRATFVFKHWQQYHQTRTLAFCISKKHADFMAAFFNSKGIKSAAVHSDSDMRRNVAISALKNAELSILFTVDLFNEGVDIPSIDTVLMLRPTDSKIIFLQQLGRGLRLSAATGKDKLNVVDFIGNHISFFRKAEALFKLGITNKDKRKFIQNIKDDNLKLPEGCFVNYDLQSIAFMETLIGKQVDKQKDIYKSLSDSLGYRPSISEFYRAGGILERIRKEYGGWFEFVKEQNDLNNDECNVLLHQQKFLSELAVTSLFKSYKLVLLEALMELNGFSSPPKTLNLAKKSFSIFQRRRSLLVDLKDEHRSLSVLDSKSEISWHQYWLKNPVNAWVGGGKSNKSAFFEVNDDIFIYKHKLDIETQETFENMVQEMINYRFLQYETRLANKNQDNQKESVVYIKPEGQEIPYFSDLRIACGHFRNSEHGAENEECKSLPLTYGHLEPGKHFIARASGNSMNGGKNPIKDGDYLLLELITATNAGSNNGYIIAIERQDAAGDEQYLLRNVVKTSEGYKLIANNSDYEPMMATDEMQTFARFKSVIDPSDLYLHQSFMREEIPPLFGLEFNKGAWQAGHITPKNTQDQFLLVTLNKQGKAIEHQYHDRFIDESNFQWQSQNSASVEGSKGKAIINHQRDGRDVHLFVRKNKLQNGLGAPFIYCGKLQYLNHEDEKPMKVFWKLEAPLTEELLLDFS